MRVDNSSILIVAYFAPVRHGARVAQPHDSRRDHAVDGGIPAMMMGINMPLLSYFPTIIASCIAFRRNSCSLFWVAVQWSLGFRQE
jgi:hypothetical protein